MGHLNTYICIYVNFYEDLTKYIHSENNEKEKLYLFLKLPLHS